MNVAWRFRHASDQSKWEDPPCCTREALRLSCCMIPGQKIAVPCTSHASLRHGNHDKSWSPPQQEAHYIPISCNCVSSDNPHCRMHSFTYISLLVTTACLVSARSAQHVGKKLPERTPRSPGFPEDVPYPQYNKRQYVNTTSSKSSLCVYALCPLANCSRIRRQWICYP